MRKTVTIIGAGPAGMTAALFAARNNFHVRLIDSNPIVGRKLLVTGSGRANLTNQQMDASRFTCSDPAWMRALLRKFGYTELIEFLDSIGVLTFATPDGWCYPVSESAQTVVDTFWNALNLANMELLLNTKVTAINKEHGKDFNFTLASGEITSCDHLILAAGGKAYPTLGSRGELFDSLEQLGHTVLPLTPALAPVTCDMRPFKKLFGVRLDAKAKLFESRKLLAETKGNLIFTQWGLNGPAVMDLSHYVSARPGKELELRLDLLHMHTQKLFGLFENQRRTHTAVRILLGSVLPPKVAPVVLAMVGLSPDVTLNNLHETQIEKLFDLLANLPFKVTGVRGFEFCQVSAGGVPVSEVDPLTMHSQRVPGLSLAGETLDVIGPCGGFNLQFAFSSGAIAGMSI
jgi:predicted Rossmann fold flavoprotein